MLVKNPFWFKPPNPNYGAGYALFAGGYVGTGGYSAVTDKYAYNGTGVGSGTSLSSVRRSPTGTSNGTTALFLGGLNNSGVAQTTVDKYATASDVLSAGTSLGTGITANTTANSTNAYIMGGQYTATSYTNGVQTYAWANDSINASAGSLAGAARNFAGCCGNAATAFFAGGQSTGSQYYTTTDIYTYSSNTAVAGTALSQLLAWPASASTTTTGYVVGGVIQTVGVTGTIYQFVYSSSSLVTASASLHTPKAYSAGGNNASAAIFGGGFTSATPSVAAATVTSEILVFAAGTTASGNNLSLARGSLAGATTVIGNY